MEPTKAEQFLKEFLASKAAKGVLGEMACIEQVDKLEFKQLNCTVLNLAYFDFL